ncbi:hypothetical protein BCEN4_580003 [Burkholderia cenocepacia]|nr:hypothetical protein BCEN4_580003 [Burkholderia cenocepacia]
MATRYLFGHGKLKETILERLIVN